MFQFQVQELTVVFQMAVEDENADTTQSRSHVSSGQSQDIDYNHPLFLSLSDVSGYNLLLFQLLGTENYTLWSITITLALLGQNKLGVINESCNKEVFW